VVEQAGDADLPLIIAAGGSGANWASFTVNVSIPCHTVQRDAIIRDQMVNYQIQKRQNPFKLLQQEVKEVEVCV